MSGPSSRRPKAVRIYIQLGRTGDAIASVPLCYHYWKETGQKCALMVAREFSSFLEGIKYIEPEIWDGDWKDVSGAFNTARNLGYHEVKVAQIYGTNVSTPHLTTSFILDSWRQVGMLEHFDKVPLVFDNRNMHRESELACDFPADKPVVLVAASGFSAPFPHDEELLSRLRSHLGSRAHVINMAEYRSPHFHDFLGLIDRAAVFVTGDTGFGQLAVASKTPVIALAASLPTTWYSSPRRKQHIEYVRYAEFHDRFDDILKAVDTVVK